MKPINVGLLGLGTVGAGVVNLLAENRDEIVRRAGREIRVTRAAVRDTTKTRECHVAEIDIGTDCQSIVDDPNIDVVLELIGGDGMAFDLTMAAIERGKHVITANKHLIALHGNAIFAAAERNNVVVSFEAAVAGGIPIIKAMRESLSANRIEWVAGIINGTGNFILSQMMFEGVSFEYALAEAQRRGFAEADPTFDIEGIDAAHKLAIIGSIAFGIPLSLDRVHTEGIRHLTAHDIAYASQLGYRVKALGIAKRTQNGVELRVHPTLVPEKALLANVENEKNAVMVYGDALGPTVYYGAGAGAGPTASAVVADMTDTIRVLSTDPSGRVPHLAFQPDQISNEPIRDRSDFECGHYLRVQVADQAGVMAAMTEVLADLDISIDAILQKDLPASNGEGDAHVIVITKSAREGNVLAALERIEAFEFAYAGSMHLRVAHFED
ncbi:homoserine dehydrogenase [Salinisphaera sp. USBA-960]|uniref:homoserine dehydrogenase n=1 Tax=Salinisphaera orenii TaxID=856731 RepID=UPI000DBE72C8|nr:homoserine dehydrogenase [Salifodinibacter halophilus]NNC26373.1 homoserine dehydrogenase [Salifodinibacter halophilus]